jgi:hypothetical protein
MCQENNKRMWLKNAHGKHWPDEEAMELLQGALVRMVKAGRELLVWISHRSLETDEGEF